MLGNTKRNASQYGRPRIRPAQAHWIDDGPEEKLLFCCPRLRSARVLPHPVTSGSPTAFYPCEPGVRFATWGLGRLNQGGGRIGLAYLLRPRS